MTNLNKQTSNGMKIFNKNSAKILSFSLLMVPTVVYGAGLIPCGDLVDSTGKITNPCEFEDLITLANRIIHFLMYDVAVPLAALGFMYAGARLVLFQNKEGEWTEAKKRFGDIALGFGIILAAYVLIKVILFAFLKQEQIDFMKFMFDVAQ